MTDGKEPLRKLLKEIVSYVEMLIICIFTVSMIFTYVVGIVSVSGDSMRSSLSDGDKVLMLKLPFSPDCGDIVIINAQYAYTLDNSGNVKRSAGIGKTIVKRVIACEGQTIDIDFEKGSVCIDGEKLSEDYVTLGLTHLDSGAFTNDYPLTVPEGYCFVMGDNRGVSKDSRSYELGFVSRDELEGRVIFRLSPFGSVS